jgi:chemosensory pili system protein ChpA (sensor histidine kinase/response regulator)
MAEQEVLDALCTELEEGESELALALAGLLAPGAGAVEMADRYAEYLRRFANAADMFELPSLKVLAEFFESNALALSHSSSEDRGRSERRELFGQWPKLLVAFLKDTANTTSLGRLMRQVQDPAWPSPMDEERALDLAERLFAEAAVGDSAHDEVPPAAAADAQGVGSEDVSLRFSEDINPQLVNAFLHETPQHVNRLSQAIQRITSRDGGVEDIVQAQRVAHTVKGSANITGIAGIANLTHRMEDILEHLASREKLPPPGLADTLVDGGDCLEMMVEYLLGLGGPPEQALDALRRLADWSERLERGEYDVGDTSDVTTVVLPREALHDAPVQVVDLSAPAPVQAAGSADGAVLRVAIETIDDLLRLAGEMAISIVQIQGRHQRTLGQVNALTEQNALLYQRLSALQDLVQVRGVPAARHALIEVAGADDDDFDPLELDTYSELHSATNAFAEALTDARELTDILRSELVGLDGVLVQHEQISSQLNGVVLSSRLVSVTTIVPRLQRGVRQTCRATGKRARLSVFGSDMQVDSEILNGIVDPLMHIVRNAVDHGIEHPSERIANGKDEQGLIELSFSRQGENLVVRCRDDGAGFDLHRIRELAVAQGLVAGDRHLSDRELARLTLVPGFSTRRGTTHVSGRGIGMDVVNRCVLDLRGNMDIDSVANGGSTVQLRVPLTLISMHVLLVRVGARIFGIPSSTLEQALFSDAGPVVHADDDWIFRFSDNDYPLSSLSELIGLPGQAVSTLTERVAPLLLNRTDTGYAGVMVDELVDGRYLVVKRLGRFVPRVRGVIGAAILADGSVAPVIDIHELLRQPATPVPVPSMVAPEEIELDLPNVLVVDDSLSARRTLAQVITDAGFVARTAVDGLDAIEAIEERAPDLILLDLEMPRMNGLELAFHLRGDEATRDIPLVMITSRSTAKHREQAHAAGIDAFITKPYQDDEVAEQIRLLVAPR